MQDFDDIYRSLYNYADTMKIIDTHEHLQAHKNFTGEEPDVLSDYLSHYITTDLMSAGMPEADIDKVKDYRTDIVTRFKMLEPWLDRVKNTSYYRSLEIAASRVHNVDEISLDTIGELNEKFVEAVRKDDYRRYIMKNLCNIEVSLNDNWEDDMPGSTTDLFAPVWQPSVFLDYTTDDPEPVPCFQAIDIQIEKLSFDDYCDFVREYFFKQVKEGAKALKLSVAYWRSLYFENVDHRTASKLYKKVVKSRCGFPKKLQDHLMHLILKAAQECGFIVQIHTGLQEGMGNDLENSDPMLLRNLFLKYPGLTFDLFHTGYPYERELTVLAKTHANVYVDFCWTHLISSVAARKALYEMLEVLPYTKLFGFGGDYLFYDGVVGHLTLAKKNICLVLSEKVTRNELDAGLAEKILQAVLYDNAKQVFKL